MHEVKDIPGIPPRKPDTHKGNYGRVFVLAGSLGMTGAACMSGSAALRSGAGIVTLGIPESLNAIVATKLTCVMTRIFPETSSRTLAESGFQEILDFSEQFDVVAIGPGLSQHPETKRLVLSLLQSLNRRVVLDADGINALADDPDVLDRLKGEIVLTPHPGEMARLIKKFSTREIQSRRLEIAEWFVKGRDHVTLVLKGHHTLVVNKEKYYENKTGNPGMATAGSGDVLLGIIAALAGQGFPPFDAAQLGVYLHGLAGDLAEQEKGEASMIATDILEKLPDAFRVHCLIKK